MDWPTFTGPGAQERRIAYWQSLIRDGQAQLANHEWDVLRQLRGLEEGEYDQVLTLIASFKRPLDVPPSRKEAVDA